MKEKENLKTYDRKQEDAVTGLVREWLRVISDDIRSAVPTS